MFETSVIFRFYVPIGLGLFVLLMIPWVRKANDPLKVSLHLLVFAIDLPIPSWFKGARGARWSLLVVGVSLVSYGVNADFSQFFPSALRMNVYFDDGGILQTLHQFNSVEQASLRIAAQPWDSVQRAYEAEIKRHLAAEAIASADGVELDTAGMNRGNTHGAGRTTFVVERDGVLLYRIVSADGDMQLVADVPNRLLEPIHTLFSLTDSPANYLRPTVIQLLGGTPILLAPQFKQIIRITNAPDAIAPFDHMVVGATLVTVLPVPRFSSTLYLIERSDGTRVPIAYALYY